MLVVVRIELLFHHPSIRALCPLVFCVHSQARNNLDRVTSLPFLWLMETFLNQEAVDILRLSINGGVALHLIWIRHIHDPSELGLTCRRLDKGIELLVQDQVLSQSVAYEVDIIVLWRIGIFEMSRNLAEVALHLWGYYHICWCQGIIFR